LNKNRVLSTFFELVKIDSPSQKEGCIAAYLEAKLQKLGFSVAFDNSATETDSDTGNLLAKLSGTAPGHIVLNAHMDCVDPCLGVEPYVEEGVIHSKGETILSADDKAGIAAILEALESVIEGEMPHPEIWVLFTTCEEQNLRGAKALPVDIIPEGTRCFVFDAGGTPGTIVIGSPYHYSFTAEFTGKAAHAGVEPEAGASAIQMAAAAIEAMELGRLDAYTTANVGTIEGGLAVNIVPETCRVTGECRSLYPDQLEACREQLSIALQTGANLGNGTVKTFWDLDYPGILFDEEDSLIVKLASIAQSIGLEPRFVISGGGADANILAARGAHPITLGVGMQDFHSCTEHILVKDLEDSARFAEAIITAFAEESRKSDAFQTKEVK